MTSIIDDEIEKKVNALNECLYDLAETLTHRGASLISTETWEKCVDSMFHLTVMDIQGELIVLKGLCHTTKEDVVNIAKEKDLDIHEFSASLSNTLMARLTEELLEMHGVNLSDVLD